MTDPGARGSPAPWLIIGVGNEERGDDGVGRVVARLVRTGARPNVRVMEESGEASSLIEAWKDAPNVIVCDAVRSGAARGMVCRFDARRRELPAEFSRASTHAFGLAEAVALARALDRLPRRLIVYGIEAKRVEAGAPLSPEVRRAAEALAARLLEEIG